MNKLLTIAEAAELLKVHPETLRRWDREGILTAVKVNNRGDRRYNHDTLTDFMKTHKDTIKYADPIEHQGYTIKWDFEGIITLSASFDRMARFIVKKDEGDLIGFIFYISLLSAHNKDKDELEAVVLDKVKEILSSRKPTDGDRFTFEFVSGQFVEVENPDWWEEKYSKPLLSGLRVVAEHSCPVTMKETTWRVILNFKCLQGDYWLTNSFGDKNQFHEYFVWIDAKELEERGFKNTAKSAEIVAVEFGIKRFNDTKDENGNRDIQRINENNSALFKGQWHQDSILPDELN